MTKPNQKKPERIFCRISAFFILACGVLFFGSCATNYHARGFFHTGFNDIRLGSDRFLITFRGNQYTTSEDVRRYALRRASELTLQSGYRFFAIAFEKDISKITEIHSTSKNTELTYPGLEITIQCFEEKPSILSIDAKEFLQYNTKPHK
ncbi:MAG: hypothetical protein Tsb0015_00100 [Simkaniaceae bacterium]